MTGQLRVASGGSRHRTGAALPRGFRGGWMEETAEGRYFDLVRPVASFGPPPGQSSALAKGAVHKRETVAQCCRRLFWCVVLEDDHVHLVLQVSEQVAPVHHSLAKHAPPILVNVKPFPGDVLGMHCREVRLQASEPLFGSAP